MKLGEALLQRADVQKRIQSVKERLANCALVQEGDVPGESPAELVAAADALLAEFEALVLKINTANISGKLGDGTSLSAALAHRDALILKHSILSHMLDAMRKREDRYSLKEIRYIPTLSIADSQKQLDAVSRAIRELNASIQESNWRIDV